MSNLMKRFLELDTKKAYEMAKDLPPERRENAEFTISCVGFLQYGMACMIKAEYLQKNVEESMESAQL